MKKPLLFILLFISCYGGYSQVYIPMPADSATWRYRIYTDDFLEDFMLLLNGADTFANGYTYHQVFSRTYFQPGPFSGYPPIVPETASYPDIYYGGIRESSKQVFFLGDTHEELIYDFNAVVGDSIPGFTSKYLVTAIDSVLLAGVYHKRYLTNDTSFYVIEGVGSSMGLLPDLTNGAGDIAFFCFTYPPVVFSPMDTAPCTYIYPYDYAAATPVINSQTPEVNVYPVPATEVLHITLPVNGILQAAIINYIGQEVWSGSINGQFDIPVATWPRGFYYLRIEDEQKGIVVKKVVVE